MTANLLYRSCEIGWSGSRIPAHDRSGVDHAVVAEDHLPGEHPQQVAGQERRDQQEQEDVLALRPGEREEVRQRIRERDGDDRDDQRHLHRLPEQAQVERAVEEVVPRLEREPLLARIERVDVEAVERDDRDRREEEDAEPGQRQAEQGRSREVEPAPTGRRRGSRDELGHRRESTRPSPAPTSSRTSNAWGCRDRGRRSARSPPSGC